MNDVLNIIRILAQHELWLENNNNGQRANLQHADLRDANLQHADLQHADLQHANLQHADLQHADLRDANLDFSCFPLWCGSFKIKVDDNILEQLLTHIIRLDISRCSQKNKLLIKKIPICVEQKLKKRHKIY